VELERGDARFLLRIDRYAPEEDAPADDGAGDAPAEEQLVLFADDGRADDSRVASLPRLAPVAAPPVHAVRRLSYSALALFERCSYRYFAERVVGMRPADADGGLPGRDGLAATEIGDAVHRLLELVDLAAPAVPDLEVVRGWYPSVSDDELALIARLVEGYCSSGLARRIAALRAPEVERAFAFEHDGVLLHGRLDVLHRSGEHALVVDYKTNALGEDAPGDVVEREYHLQRLVYALVCLRAGARAVEVVYQFLERPDELVATTFRPEDEARLAEELSAAIARIESGDFRPTPSEYACSGCPALDRVCAGPRLREQPPAAALAAAR